MFDNGMQRPRNAVNANGGMHGTPREVPPIPPWTTAGSAIWQGDVEFQDRTAALILQSDLYLV
ncbi:hypothetical protein PSCICJ_07260 [Pseudomonas cichorii]|nr:hypothetical protein PSCICJ_07260 [Pseudomonas cichorii]